MLNLTNPYPYGVIAGIAIGTIGGIYTAVSNGIHHDVAARVQIVGQDTFTIREEKGVGRLFAVAGAMVGAGAGIAATSVFLLVHEVYCEGIGFGF